MGEDQSLSQCLTREQRVTARPVIADLIRNPQGGVNKDNTNHIPPSPLMGEESKVRVTARQTNPSLRT